MDLFRLLEQQLEKQSVGTLTLGRRKGFREIFFDRDAAYLVGNKFTGKIEFDQLLASDSIWKKIDIASLEAIILSTDLKRNLLPQVLLDQGIIDEDELKPLAEAQLKEEVFDLLSQDSGSFHFQDGRVPESLLQCDDIHTRIPVSLTEIVELLQRRGQALSRYQSLIPSDEEVFVITEKGMAYKQANTDDFVQQRVLDMIDGFRDRLTILNDCFFFEYGVNDVLAQCIEEGYIKKTLHPELKGLSVNDLSKEGAAKHLELFKNSVRHGVDELAARERLALVYEKLEMINDAVIQYNFVGDTLFRMRKPGKATEAYQRALTLKPGEVLLTDKITKIYITAAESEVEAGNIEQAIHLLEGALKISPEKEEVASRLLDLLVSEEKYNKIGTLCDTLANSARKSRSPGAALCVLKCMVDLLPDNGAFRKKLINLYLDFDHTEEAINEMGALAERYLDRGQEKRAKELRIKISRLQERSCNSQVLRHRVTPRSPPQEKKRTLRYRLTRSLAVGILLLLATYQCWSFLAWHEIREAYVLGPELLPKPINAQGLIETLPPEERRSLVIAPGSSEARFHNLMVRCDKFMFQFTASLFTPLARQYHAWAQTNAGILHEERACTKNTILELAMSDWQREGNVATATKILEPLLSLGRHDLAYKKAAELEALWNNRAGEAAGDLLERAEELLAEHHRLIRKGDATAMKTFDQAFALFAELLKRYPQSQHLNNFTLPVFVQTVPKGATLQHTPNPFGKERSETLPATVRVYNESTEFLFTKPGYKTEVRFVTPEELRSTRGKIVKLLRRTADQTLSLTDGELMVQPVVGRGYIFWGSDTGALSWQRLETRGTRNEPIFKASFSGSDLVGSIVFGSDAVWSRWDDGVIRRLPFEQLGKPTPNLKEFSTHRIITTELHTVGTDQPIVLFGIEDALLKITPSGVRSAFHPSPGLRLRATTLKYHPPTDDFFVGHQEGFVRQLGVRKRPPGNERRLWTGWAKHVGDGVVNRIAISGDTIIVGVADQLYLRQANNGSLDENRKIHSVSTKGVVSCIHEGAGKILTWSPEKGVRSLDLPTGRFNASPSELNSVLEGKTITQIYAAESNVAIVFRRKGSKRKATRHILLVCDAESLKPVWATDAGVRPLHVTSADGWLALADKKAIKLFFE